MGVSCTLCAKELEKEGTVEQEVDDDVLSRIWTELDYRCDICRFAEETRSIYETLDVLSFVACSTFLFSIKPEL
jgi:hypothetical protein